MSSSGSDRQNMDMKQREASVPPIYTPLSRPQSDFSFNKSSEKGSFPETMSNSSLELSSVSHSSIKSEEADKYSSSASYSSGDNSDSNSNERVWPDTRQPGIKAKKIKIPYQYIGVPGPTDDGGEMFKSAAAAYQNSLQANSGTLPTSALNRKDKRKTNIDNNVWGSVLREDALTSELKQIAVGQKSIQNLRSDRGAEAYDYVDAAKSHAVIKEEGRKNNRKLLKEKLDQDLGCYWSKIPKEDAASDYVKSRGWRKENAIRAGKKRRFKEILVTNKSYNISGHDFVDGNKPGYAQGSNVPDNIPELGVPRTIPDLPEEVNKFILTSDITIKKDEPCSSSESQSHIKDVKGNMQQDIKSQDGAKFLANQLATCLYEPKSALIFGVVDLVGAQVALEIFQKTQQIEAEGGMAIKNGARRRTPGGVFLQLIRDINDPSVAKKVKQFLSKKPQRNDFHQEQKFQGGSNQQYKNRAYHRYKSRHPYRKTYGADQRCKHSSGEGPKKEDSFQSELEALQKLSDFVRNKRKQDTKKPVKLLEKPVDMEEERENVFDGAQKINDEEVQQLPDILTCISKQISSNIQDLGNTEHNVEDSSLKKPDFSTSSPSGLVVSQHDLASYQRSTSSSTWAIETSHSSQSSQLDFEPDESEASSTVERLASTKQVDLLSDFSTKDIKLL